MFMTIIRMYYNNVRFDLQINTSGLTRSSDEVRELLVYVCCGKGKLLHKQKDAIVILHKRLQNGFHRFGETETVHKNWSEFFKLLKKYPNYVKFLDDRGKGAAPERYLIVVEKCLRRVASNDTLAKYAMGKFAMRTYEQWINTKYWFKREAYIAAVRAFRGLPKYRKYISYDWKDYMMRTAVSKTFLSRHKKYTNGEEKLNIPDPKCWAEPLIRRRTKKTTVNTDSGSETEAETDDSNTGSMVWDSDTGEWEQLE